MCEDNPEMDLKEVGCAGEDWINLAYIRNQLRAFVNTVHILWCTLQIY
jgi:hypothetical protein